MRKAMWFVGGVLAWSLIFGGCSGPGPGNRPGRPVTRISPSRPGEVAGLGIESQDLQEVADKMLRSILDTPVIAGAEKPPTVVLLPVENNTRFPINKDIFLSLIKARLNRYATWSIFGPYPTRKKRRSVKSTSGLPIWSMSKSGTERNAKLAEWRACRFQQPAFILGNGPTLPEDLSRLDGFFTVGVNRILYRYDPTVLMWWDDTVHPDIEHLLPDAKCLVLDYLDTAGNNAGSQRIFRPLTPDVVPVTCSAGVSAAFWAMSLGCSPIYLLGMSATVLDGKTDFYGDNPHHQRSTMTRIRMATDALLAFPDVIPVDDLNDLCIPFRPRSRAWYLSQLPGVRTW